MANNIAAVRDLTADGYLLQQDEIGIHFEITRGLNELPTVRGADDIVSHRTGRVARSRVADVLDLELTGFVMGIGSDMTACRASYRGLIQALQAVFDPTKDPWTLSCTLEDGTAASITVRAVDMAVTGGIPELGSAEMKVALESIGPGWSTGGGPGAWTSYDPNWQAADTDLADLIGVGGTLTGRYRRGPSSGLLDLEIVATLGTGFDIPAGAWTFSLPVPPGTSGYSGGGGGAVEVQPLDYNAQNLGSADVVNEFGGDRLAAMVGSGTTEAYGPPVGIDTLTWGAGDTLRLFAYRLRPSISM